MDVRALLSTVVTAACLAAALAVVFTAPPRSVVPTFICGFVTSLARTGLAELGFPDGWSTAIAAAIAVVVAVAVTPRRLAAPVVVIAAIFPLSAGVAVFDAIADLLKVSTSHGAALYEASVSLTANLGRAFATFAAIAFGLEVGIAIVRLFRPGREV